MQRNIIKKFVLMGALLVSFFALTSVASAALYVEYSSNGGPWQTADPSGFQSFAPLTVRVTYYVDPNSDPNVNPELTSYRWSCDPNGVNQADSTGPSVTCSYGAPGTYDIRLQGTGPAGGYNPGVTIHALAPGDIHQPIRYVGPTTLYRATVWGIQSPKPLIDPSVYFGQGGYSVDMAKCPASMPAGTRCFRLGKNSPTGRSVLIETYASAAGSGFNADKVDQHVKVLPDPLKATTSKYRVKRRGSCTYGGKINLRTGVPATALVDVSLQMRLGSGKWKTMGKKSVTRRYGPSASSTVAGVRYSLMRGPIVSAARRRGARFRFVYQGRVTDGTLKYYDSRRRTVGLSPSQVLSCRM